LSCDYIGDYDVITVIHKLTFALNVNQVSLLLLALWRLLCMESELRYTGAAKTGSAAKARSPTSGVTATSSTAVI